jgi:phosphatidate phosphatase APP1
LYAEIAEQYPSRILAIYIRDVDPDHDSAHDLKVDDIIRRSEQLGVPFVRVADSTMVAEHAASLGLISSAILDDVEHDVEVDKQRDSVAEEIVQPDRE